VLGLCGGRTTTAGEEARKTGCGGKGRTRGLAQDDEVYAEGRPKTPRDPVVCWGGAGLVPQHAPSTLSIEKKPPRRSLSKKGRRPCWASPNRRLREKHSEMAADVPCVALGVRGSIGLDPHWRGKHLRNPGCTAPSFD